MKSSSFYVFWLVIVMLIWTFSFLHLSPSLKTTILYTISIFCQSLLNGCIFWKKSDGCEIYSLVRVNIFAASSSCLDCLCVLILNHVLPERKDQEVRLMTDWRRQTAWLPVFDFSRVGWRQCQRGCHAWCCAGKRSLHKKWGGGQAHAQTHIYAHAHLLYTSIH